MPLQITFRGMSPSPALEERIRQESERLAQLHDRITSCRVVVAVPPRHHTHGGLYDVRIHLAIPGGHLDVMREPGRDHAHEDPFVAVRDAFDSAVRQLEDHVRVQRAHRHGAIID